MNTWVFVVIMLTTGGPLSTSSTVTASKVECEAMRSTVKTAFAAMKDLYTNPFYLFTQCVASADAAAPEEKKPAPPAAAPAPSLPPPDAKSMHWVLR